MPQETNDGPEGLWDALDGMEVSATILLSEKLAPFEPPLRSCYEAGVQASTLEGRRHEEPDIVYAALFLKRALNDLRGVWLLTQTGYTSQAACIAAALFENALAATCLAGSPDNASKLRASKSGDLPWGAQSLSKMVADRWRRQAHEKGEPFDQDDYQRHWRQAYLGYKWLCKIKHPTLRSAFHDAPATARESREYVVMAAPDTRDADLNVKAMVLMISFSRMYEAIRQFALSLDCDDSAQYYVKFIERLNSAHSGALEAFEALVDPPLPF